MPHQPKNRKVFGNWRDTLNRARFRGVRFFVKTSEISIGRRTYIEKPINTRKRDSRPFVDDRGLDTEEYKFDAFVIANQHNNFDYIPDMKKLINALKKRGHGTLEHPILGERHVQLVEHAKIKEEYVEAGGMAVFTLKFIETRKRFIPDLKIDFSGRTDKVASTASNRTSDDFFSNYRTGVAFVGSLSASASKAMGKVTAAISNILNGISSTFSAGFGVATSAIALIDTVLQVPCDFVNLLKNVGDSFLSLAGMTGEVVIGGVVGGCSGDVRGDVIKLDGKSIPENLGSSIIVNMEAGQNFDETDFESIASLQEDNRRIMIDSLKAFVLINMARIAVRIEFLSQQQMAVTLAIVTAAMEAFLQRLGEAPDTVDNNDTYSGMDQLRAEFTSIMFVRMEELAKEIEHEVDPGIVSTLVLAYDQYEDIDRDEEIRTRNRIAARHPGFLPSGSTINILHE